MAEKLREKKKLRDGKRIIVLCSLYTGGGVFV